MKYLNFKQKMKELCDKNEEKRPKLIDYMYMYEKYNHTIERIKDRQMAQEMLGFNNMKQEERLRYRNKLANEGIELTPYQVNLYIYMMMIAAARYLETH